MTTFAMISLWKSLHVNNWAKYWHANDRASWLMGSFLYFFSAWRKWAKPQRPMAVFTMLLHGTQCNLICSSRPT